MATIIITFVSSSRDSSSSSSTGGNIIIIIISSSSIDNISVILTISTTVFELFVLSFVLHQYTPPLLF